MLTTYKDMDLKMSPGERGCATSHISAWRSVAQGAAPVLIFEDDVALLPNFTSTLVQAVAEAPPGSGIIFLTSDDRVSGRRRPAGKVLMEPFLAVSTTAYLLWPEAARKLLKMLPLDMPVDNFLAFQISKGAIRGFSLKNKGAAVQEAGAELESSVPHSDDIAKLDVSRAAQTASDEAAEAGQWRRASAHARVLPTV